MCGKGKLAEEGKQDKRKGTYRTCRFDKVREVELAPTASALLNSINCGSSIPEAELNALNLV
jgi:hypothetical protein